MSNTGRRAGLVVLSVALLHAAAAQEPNPARETAPPPRPRSAASVPVRKGLELRGIGPSLTPGRVGDIAVDPRNRSVWYVALASGGLWKTTNRGVTWKSVFDNHGSYSIGCVTLDPKRPDVVWLGTGEN